MGIGDRRWLLVSPRRKAGRPWSVHVADEEGAQRDLPRSEFGGLADVVARAAAAGPLPIFVRGDAQAPRLNHRILGTLRPFVRDGKVRVVRLAHAAYQARPPLKLPLTIAFVGDLDRRIRQPLVGTRWLSADVAAYGLRVEELSLAQYARLHDDRDRIDVAVCDVSTMRSIFGLGGRRAWPPRHPRLIVVIDRPRAISRVARRTPPAGVATLVVPCLDPDAGGRFVRELARQLTHDRSLSEAVAAARALTRGGSTTLIADPASHWGISLSEAHQELMTQARTIERAVAGWPEARPPVHETVPVGTRRLGDGLLTAEGALGLAAEEVSAAAEIATPSFLAESGGLTGMAHLNRRLADYRSASARLFGSAKEPEAPRIPRAVEMALERMRPAPSFVEVDPSDPSRVLRHTVLAAGVPYRLVVQIGASLVGGLVDAAVPIDPLLPPSADGHRLEVAVLGLGLAVESSPVVAIHLPPVGPSDPPARFTVQAPVGFEGVARARVLVTFLDNVLQSWVLHVQVGAQERDGPLEPPAIETTLEHSVAPGFERLSRVRAREAALVLNAGPGGGSHTIQVKRLNGVATTHFREADIDTIARDLRGELTQWAGGTAPLFPEPPPKDPDAQAKRARWFADAVRRLAKQGAALYRNVLVQVGTAGQPVVRELRRVSGQTIQIVQASGSFGLPWALLYDWSTPTPYADFDRLPVCDGSKIVDPPSAPSSAGPSCGHSCGTANILCARGFWGYRHGLEIVLADPTNMETIDEVRAFDRPLRVSVGKSITSAALVPEFAQAYKDQAVAIAAGVDVSTLLWSTDRPAVLIALGKLTTSGAGLTQSAEIDLVPTLADIGVANWIAEQGPWNDPHSLIMLMACGSAAGPPGALLNLTRVFLGAGAGAVVGAETDVFSSAASRFAESVRSRLIQPGALRLGEAVTAARWDLLQGHSPVGLTFVAYGNADLRIITGSA
jgi:CHAT domain